jgi:hypothetical protein
VRIQTGAVSTGYIFQIDSSTQVSVYRIISGAGTLLGSRTTSTITLGTTIVGISVSGVDATVTLKVYLGDYPGTQQGADITDSDAARIVTAGSVGIYAESSGSGGGGMDDWAGGWS